LDLSGSEEAIVAVIRDARPDVVVSAAAYTAVDKAESEPALAYAINEAGAGAVARAVHFLAVPLIHMSTDYVFDGAKTAPFVEDDAPAPTGVYGASKLAGEKAVLAAHQDVAVLRTAWVYSPFGANFVKTMLRLARERDEINVVGDQRGNPTSALDIADGVIAVAGNLLAGQNPDLRGIFHMAGGGHASWAEFADAIFVASAAAGGPTAEIKTIATSDYPTPARRPANSLLSVERLATAHGVRLPEWRNSLTRVVEQLVRGDDFTRIPA
jgi:dTDP-4-dehydrorhamnose reductase